MISVEFKPEPDIGFKFLCAKIFADVSQSTEIVAGVKVVDPFLPDYFRVDRGKDAFIQK